MAKGKSMKRAVYSKFLPRASHQAFHARMISGFPAHKMSQFCAEVLVLKYKPVFIGW
jgi:hypothetical protein